MPMKSKKVNLFIILDDFIFSKKIRARLHI